MAVSFVNLISATKNHIGIARWGVRDKKWSLSLPLGSHTRLALAVHWTMHR